MDLTRVSTADLDRLSGALERGQLGFPITAHGLRALGLDSLWAHAASLSLVGREGSRLVVTAILLERNNSGASPELVWTGPETRQSAARDTSVVLADLFGSSRESVLIAGFVFDHGATVLPTLHEAMKRGVHCRVFADENAAGEFRKRNWPFGPPFPQVSRFVPEAGVFASLHAKCVVVDHRRVFVTSANFTDRGQNRNVEVGVLMDDQALAAALETQFSSAKWFWPVDE